MKHLPPTVSLDSVQVRLIRETNKVTQLYVSKVVGVTPDTISRWENNRYPTVKRENALRLAEALEVDVTAILKLEESDSATGEMTTNNFPSRSIGRWSVLFLGLAAGLAIFWFSVRTPIESLPNLFAERWLPRYAAPGSKVPVRIQFETDAQLRGFILRERFPVGWIFIEGSPAPASLDNIQGMARWIIKPGEDLSAISYLLRVDGKAVLGTRAGFTGEVVVGPEKRSRLVSVSGTTRMELAPFHWADSNGDRQVDDGEMLTASEDFAAMPGLRLNWNLLEKIWDGGGYLWDGKAETFVPAKISSDSLPPSAPAPANH